MLICARLSIWKTPIVSARQIMSIDRHAIGVIGIAEIGQLLLHIIMQQKQLESLGEAGQHAQGQNIDLQNIETIEIVLVPLDHVAIVHRRMHDRHDLIQPVPGDDEAADMLGEVTRKTHQRRGAGENALRRPIPEIEAGNLRLAFGQFFTSTSPRHRSPRPTAHLRTDRRPWPPHGRPNALDSW